MNSEDKQEIQVEKQQIEAESTENQMITPAEETPDFMPNDKVNESEEKTQDNENENSSVLKDFQQNYHKKTKYVFEDSRFPIAKMVQDRIHERH